MLFSAVFEITGTVADGVRPSVNSACQALKEEVGVSVASVYNKPNRLETGTSEESVRCAAGEIFLCGIAKRGGHFTIRQYANLPWSSLGPGKYRGATETGKAYGQPTGIVDESGGKHVFRRVREELKGPTRDGDMEIRLISSPGQKTASAKRIARLYGKKRTVEIIFKELKSGLGLGEHQGDRQGILSNRTFPPKGNGSKFWSGQSKWNRLVWNSQ